MVSYIILIICKMSIFYSNIVSVLEKNGKEWVIFLVVKGRQLMLLESNSQRFFKVIMKDNKINT